jgi:hypothetical protein
LHARLSSAIGFFGRLASGDLGAWMLNLDSASDRIAVGRQTSLTRQSTSHLHPPCSKLAARAARWKMYAGASTALLTSQSFATSALLLFPSLDIYTTSRHFRSSKKSSWRRRVPWQLTRNNIKDAPGHLFFALEESGH